MTGQELEASILRITSGDDLSVSEAEAVARCLLDVGLDAALKRSLLVALQDKRETPEELFGFAKAFRAVARIPDFGDFPLSALDVVGTGGDGFGSFNLSTTAALLVAACGVPVIKHGNRSITSKCGSADFLEALGVNLTASAEVQRHSLESCGFCFLFAPHYHPAFQVIGPIRKALAAEGRRTIFNLLGPLLNPAAPAFGLFGVFAPRWVGPMAEAFHQSGCRAGVVAHCVTPDGAGLDELTTCGRNFVAGFGRLQGMDDDWQTEPLSPPDHLKGGSLADNLKLLEDLCAGTAPVGLTDSLCLTAGAGLWIAEKAACLEAGIALAKETLHNGTFQRWLKRLSAAYQS